jgi:hypothetical protein
MMRRLQLFAFALILIAGLAVVPEFTSSSAKQAAAQYEKDIAKSRSTYTVSLKRAMQIAARDKDLDEVARIASEIKKQEALGSSDDREGQGSGKPFVASQLAGLHARFIWGGGSREVLLVKNGSLDPQKMNEFFWRVTDTGHLQFLREDKTLQTEWPEYFISGGRAYGCTMVNDKDDDPNIIAFTKQEAKP